MKDVTWFVSRLKSMNVPEVMWRIQQKMIQQKEYKTFFAAHKPVTDIKVSKELEMLKADGRRLNINWDNKEWKLFESLDLFGIFDYSEYKTRWNAGFQTDNEWPIYDFSYSIPISQREDIGDIRTNWELNRHFQFVGLAKNYYLTGERKYLDELYYLFDDWNKMNFFLHGVQWTSAMEIAIRIVSWSYAYAFIEKVSEQQELLNKLANGIKVMANYILVHRARYSSANNHLIVEMLGLGVAGILFNYEKWIDYSIKVMTEELPRQNYPDGVNKEMSLHYQTFVMEAYGIMAVLLRRNRRLIPNKWLDYLENMSGFVADCCGDYGETVVFGDNDEGKLLDFIGKIDNHYHYVLQLMGIVLSKRYTDSDLVENIKWIATSDELDEYKNKDCYQPRLVSHYEQGGYTVLRSKDRKVLIGFDHAELGFGSIAAHGHEDALSVQIYYRGIPVLIDSGTYNYHVPKNKRNEFRNINAHNAFQIDNEHQAEFLGPFLWGKRYRVQKNELEMNKDSVLMRTLISYKGISHTRIITFDFNRTITITDEVDRRTKCRQYWNVIKDPIVHEHSKVSFAWGDIITTGVIMFENAYYSKRYNHIAHSYRLISSDNCGKIETKISIRG